MNTHLPLLPDLLYWIKERQMVHARRAAGNAAPWTEDHILQQYRFCNVRREDDRVTRWIHDTWLRPNETRAFEDLMFAAAVARLVNWPDSLAKVKFPAPWRPAKFTAVLNARKAREEKVFTSAYMIRAIEAKNGETKADYLAKYVLTPLWEQRKNAPKDSLRALHNWLLPFYGMGSFISAQIVADVKWTPALRSAPDWATFAAPGPGSMRGLNRVLGRDVKAPWQPEAWHTELLRLRKALLPKLPKGLRDLDAQNVQNCLCEFDKYMRAKNGEGRPRQNFKPSTENYA